jgi:predicted Zn-dependent peptidase
MSAALPAADDVVPALGPPPRVRRARTAERTLANGLRVVVVRQAGVPLVEMRLRVPFAGTPRTATTHAARSALLGDTMLAGTAERSQVEIAEALQRLGADMHVSTDADRLLVGGNTLATGLPALLGLLAEVLTTATYPSHEVAGERDRLVERLAIARAQPSVLAREALAERMYDGHPYAKELPDVDAVRRVNPAALRRLHAERVAPAGSTLILVGDLSPARTLDRVEQALDVWRATGSAGVAPPLPEVARAPTLIVDRPGSVQSAIRLGGPALRRDDPDYPALQLANLVFGGYFSSRLTENIREDKGYTYTPNSRLDHAAAGSALVVQADVATEVTAPALLEMQYELGRMATGPVQQSELDNVRQYAIGNLAMSVATQTGLASTLSALAGVGLDIDWLREHPRHLATVTLDEVYAQARRFLAPARLVTVVLGDAAGMASSVEALGDVEVRPAARDAVDAGGAGPG